jgi:uncharacterized protein
MKIAIAGGSGLIGRHLVHALLREDHEVVILSRSPDRVRAAFPERVRVVGWDPTGLDLDWALELANATAVVNLCAAPSLGAIDSLIDAMASLPLPDRPRAFVSASSIEIYGDKRDETVTETSAVGQAARARLWVERESAAMVAEHLTVRVVLLRTALVIGRDAPALNRLALPFRCFIGGPVGSGEQWISWIGIDDAVGLVARAIGSWDICGALNVASPQSVRQREFADTLGRVLRLPSRVTAPSWAVRAGLGDKATLLLGSRRVWPGKALSASYEFKQPELQVALATLRASNRRPRGSLLGRPGREWPAPGERSGPSGRTSARPGMAGPSERRP